jgi:hypothetical protein
MKKKLKVPIISVTATPQRVNGDELRKILKSATVKNRKTLEEKLRAKFEVGEATRGKVEVEEGQGFRIIKDCFYQTDLRFIVKVAAQHKKLYYISTFYENGRDKLFCNIFKKD